MVSEEKSATTLYLANTERDSLGECLLKVYSFLLTQDNRS